MATRTRTHTPDEVTIREDGTKSMRITMKRCCNGCDQKLGDVADWDIDARGELTDVRGECDNCRPVVDLEEAGCKTWQLTPRNLARVDNELDRLGVFAKQYTKADGDGHVVTIGLRVGAKPGHVVALFGDWIIRHPDGGFTVHAGPTEA